MGNIESGDSMSRSKMADEELWILVVGDEGIDVGDRDPVVLRRCGVSGATELFFAGALGCNAIVGLDDIGRTRKGSAPLDANRNQVAH